DEGYFSKFSAQDRIRAAEHTFDLGEYLKRLQSAGELDPPANTITGRMLYFPPCHGREQKIGRPYMELLGRIPGIQLESIDGHFYCCGMAGIMGFKREFHEPSTQLGRRLMDKIREIDPDRIVTDCLSCRLQFNQLLPFPVSHPIEVLRDAFGCNGA
ncbi:MAG: heterodisulfide reductase-related iron-sulfur binding cluster, partial [Desulfobacterales bacterium]